MIRFHFIELESRVCFCLGKKILRDLTVRTIIMVPVNCMIPVNHASPEETDEILLPEIFLQ